jgi:hypothetical protein
LDNEIIDGLNSGAPLIQIRRLFYDQFRACDLEPGPLTNFVEKKWE